VSQVNNAPLNLKNCEPGQQRTAYLKNCE